MSLLPTYWHKLGNALLNFQYIEEALRTYLWCVYNIVKLKLGNQIPFKFSRKDVKTDSLGVLIAKFEKVSSNKQLIDQLNGLVKVRNHCAHQAYLMTFEEMKDDKYLSSEIKKMEWVITHSDKCVKDLHKELFKIDKIRKSLEVKK